MKDPRLYLIHIKECVDKALSYTAGLGRDWTEEPMVFDAVCRNLEIIVEAANRLGDTFRLAHPHFPWRRIIGARNILAHVYDLIERHILQNVVERDLSVLKDQIILGGLYAVAKTSRTLVGYLIWRPRHQERTLSASASNPSTLNQCKHNFALLSWLYPLETGEVLVASGYNG